MWSMERGDQVPACLPIMTLRRWGSSTRKSRLLDTCAASEVGWCQASLPIMTCRLIDAVAEGSSGSNTLGLDWRAAVRIL